MKFTIAILISLAFSFESISQHNHLKESWHSDQFLSKNLANFFNKESGNVLSFSEASKPIGNIEFDLNNQYVIEHDYENFTDVNMSINQSETIDNLEGVYSICSIVHKGVRIDEVTNYMIAKKTYPHKDSSHYIINITFFHVKDAFTIGKTEISYFNGSGINDYTIQSSISLEVVKNIKLNRHFFSIYPNPVSDILYIKGKGNHVSIELLNSSGAILQKVQKQGKKHALNVSELPTGLYTIRLIDSETGKEESHKFIKN